MKLMRRSKPDLVRVERIAAMHRLRVVPHQHIADPPPVLVDEFGLDGMRTQRREQLLAFGVRATLDADGVRVTHE